MQKKMKIIILLLWIGAILFAVAAGITIKDRLHAAKRYELLRLEAAQGMQENTDTELPPTPGATAVCHFPASLAKTYPDLCAWITIPGTNIDYPVMWTPDDFDYYLHNDIDGIYSLAGTPFAQTAGQTPETAKILVIYSHRMLDGSMFANLAGYTQADYAAEHQTVTLSLPDGDRNYSVAAVVPLQAGKAEDEAFFDLSSAEADMDRYTQSLLAHSVIETDVPLTGEKQLLLLCTCSYHVSNGRVLVVCVRTE